MLNKIHIAILVLVLLLSELSFASLSVQILPLGTQIRYQDQADQERAMQSFTHYFISGLLDKTYMMALEYNKSEAKTGNSSLSVTSITDEYNLILGMNFVAYQADVSEKQKIVLSGAVIGCVGQNKITVKTNLLGVQDVSTQKSVDWGLGLLGNAQLGMFLAQLDFRLMNSTSYEPQSVFSTGLRLGLNFDF